MKPHPRIRKTIKWGGAVLTVLLVALWIGSGWWSWYSPRLYGRFIQIDRRRLNGGESIEPKATLTRIVGNDRKVTIRLDLRALSTKPPLRGLLQGFGWTSWGSGWSLHVPL